MYLNIKICIEHSCYRSGLRLLNLFLSSIDGLIQVKLSLDDFYVEGNCHFLNKTKVSFLIICWKKTKKEFTSFLIFHLKKNRKNQSALRLNELIQFEVKLNKCDHFNKCLVLVTLLAVKLF